jgi:hypothetical protein
MSRPATSGTFNRDPVSELLDSGARRILERAYATPGRWVTTRLADPDPGHVSYFGSLGIDVNAADRAGRSLNAHTRWGRAFVRSIYYQHQWYSNIGGRGWRAQRRTTERKSGALKIEVARHMAPLGVIPAGRIVRVILYPGGASAVKAVDREPDRARIFTAQGGQGGAASDVSRRDWA